MEQIVKVKRILDDGLAEVIHIRQSACSGDCHKCSGCGAAQETLIFEAKNPIGARPGDKVIVESETGPVLKSAAVLYMMPLVLFFLGYWLGSKLWGMGGLAGGAAFVIAIVLVVVYERKVMAKRDTIYTIKGYAGQ